METPLGVNNPQDYLLTLISKTRCLCHSLLISCLLVSQTLATLIDSGSDANIMDSNLAQQLGVGQIPLPAPVSSNALDCLCLCTLLVILSFWGSHGSDIGPQGRSWGGVHLVTRSASSKPPHHNLLPGPVLQPMCWGSRLSIWTSGRSSVRPRQPPFPHIGPMTAPSTSSPVPRRPEDACIPCPFLRGGRWRHISTTV